MNNEKIFQGEITKMLYSTAANYIGTGETIMFRLINFDNIIYFAEEISTRCIFPIFTLHKNSNNYPQIRTHSYVDYGLYYIYFPLVEGKKIFEYQAEESSLVGAGISIPSPESIDKYQRNKKQGRNWVKKIQQMEAANKFMCDINTIKLKIRLRQNNPAPHDSIALEEISEFGYDLKTQQNLCELIGREEEIKKIVKAVGIRQQSVLLIGESGSGKTSIVEKLALDIKNNSCPLLEDKIIFYLNIASLTAGTKYRGDFEKNLLKVVNFCRNHPGQIILFIDEIHSLYKLGSSDGSALDCMNMLKPYISNGTLTIIGATTQTEYEEYMTNDTAFLRRFENIEISSPDKQMNIQIILSYIAYLESKYNIQLSFNEEERYQLAEYIFKITDGKNISMAKNIQTGNPTLSKSIIENAFVEAIYNGRKFVTQEDINTAIQEFNGLSLTFMSEFGYELGKQQNLCHLIAREEETKKIIKAIAIKKNSVILVGDSDSGKTSIVVKLALDIKNQKYPLLNNKMIFNLNVASLSSGTKYRGDFENKIIKLINCCKKYKGQIILFIDEIHTLYKLGSCDGQALDVMSMLKPYISNGTLTIIGTTTKTAYEEYMTRDPAFLKEFEKIDVPVPDDKIKFQILLSYISDLENKYKIKLALNDYERSELVKYIINISNIKNQRNCGDIKIAGSTISKKIIEDAFTEAIYNEKKFVTVEEIYLAIINCDKLSPSFRMTKVEELKHMLSIVQEEKKSPLVLKLTNPNA